MTRCGICGRRCVPLADYDAPTCHRCDNDMDAITVRALLVQDQPPIPRPAVKQATGKPNVTLLGLPLHEIEARVQRISDNFTARVSA